MSGLRASQVDYVGTRLEGPNMDILMAGSCLRLISFILTSELKHCVLPSDLIYRTMLDFFEALIRDGAGEKYFENPAALLFVIAPLLRTVKRISEVTYSKSSLTMFVYAVAIVTFIAIDYVVNTDHFENFLQR